MKTLKFCFWIGLFLFLPAIIPNSGLKAQEESQKENVQPAQKAPDVHYDVKKEYDENGNLTRYDSVYTWTWSGNDTALLDTAAKAEMFRQNFGDIQFNMQPFGNDPFFEGSDSLFFGPSDLFSKDFEQQFERMNQMMEEQMKMMEEMQKQFFVQPGEPGVNKEQKKEEPESKGVSL